MRLRTLTTTMATGLALATITAIPPGAAQTPKPAVAAPAASPAAKPVVPQTATTLIATVNGDPIRLGDVAAAAQAIPPETRQQMPQDQLFARLMDQLISRKALVIEARKLALDKDPAVQKQMQAAAEQVLQSAVLQKQVLPKLNEEAIKAQYDKDIAGKPPETEVHARHILVDTEAKAKDIIAQLKAGAKFEDLAKKYGDPKDAATQQGGDLGFFKKGDMLPEFSAAAFALKKGEYTQAPIHTRYGWHVIQTLETRTSQPPTYDQVHDELRQKLLQTNIQVAVAQARSMVKIVTYNPDGTPVKPAAVVAAPKKG